MNAGKKVSVKTQPSRFCSDMIENYSASMDCKRGWKTNLFVQDQCLTEHIYYAGEIHGPL